MINGNIYLNVILYLSVVSVRDYVEKSNDNLDLSKIE